MCCQRSIFNEYNTGVLFYQIQTRDVFDTEKIIIGMFLCNLGVLEHLREDYNTQILTKTSHPLEKQLIV